MTTIWRSLGLVSTDRCAGGTECHGDEFLGGKKMQSLDRKFDIMIDKVRRGEKVNPKLFRAACMAEAAGEEEFAHKRCYQRVEKVFGKSTSLPAMKAAELCNALLPKPLSLKHALDAIHAVIRFDQMDTKHVDRAARSALDPRLPDDIVNKILHSVEHDRAGYILGLIHRVEEVSPETVWNEAIVPYREVTQIDRYRTSPTQNQIAQFLRKLEASNSWQLFKGLSRQRELQRQRKKKGIDTVLKLGACDGIIVETDVRTLFEEFVKLVEDNRVQLDTLCGSGKMVSKIAAWNSRKAKLCCAPSKAETATEMYVRLSAICATVMKMDQGMMAQASTWADECLRQLETRGTASTPPRSLAVITKKSVFALLLVVVLALVCLHTVSSAQKEDTDVTVAQIEKAKHNSADIAPFRFEDRSSQPYSFAFNDRIANVPLDRPPQPYKLAFNDRIAQPLVERASSTYSLKFWSRPLLAPPEPRVVTPDTMNVLYMMATAGSLVAQSRMF
jgi:hypothetical protein